ncbi:D-lactate ferricytochrome c oxidoreductase [Microbotryomycetes sp. JL221]|nr:D-lactate ferricytochrome c oxidoreductase [Microbotryomycetes sp. JL221]
MSASRMAARLSASLRSRTAERPLSTAARPPHPLAPQRPGGVGARGAPRPKQQWSTLTAILLATLTGTATYAVGLSSGRGASTSDNKVMAQASGTDRERFKKALEEVRGWMPPEFVSVDRDDLISHGYSDWIPHDPHGLPGAVLYPRSTEDVVKIVKLASKYGIPLIPYCAGTSLEGHAGAMEYASDTKTGRITALPEQSAPRTVDQLEAGLAWTLDFAENMNQIIAIHPDDLDIVVQPGISYDAINEELKDKGIPLFFPIDPAPGAQIGGMCGTGASGTNAVKYGTMRDNVLNLTVVLANGEVIKTRQRAKKSSAGPDLGKLFIGSEGTLGIITEITLKLAPRLPTTVAVSSFPNIEAAAAAARDLVQQGISLACIELMDDVMVKAINKANSSDGRRTWPEKPSLFLKFAGNEGQMKSDIDRTRKITNANQGSNFTFAKNESEADDIWHSRKIALWSAIDYVPGSKCWTTDVCVPISNFPTLIAESRADFDSEGITGPIVSHAGDGNYHALLLFRNLEERNKVDKLVHRMVERAQRLDGTCTGEHGVGYGKMPFIENELGPGTIEILRKFKEALDPQNIMT